MPQGRSPRGPGGMAFTPRTAGLGPTPAFAVYCFPGEVIPVTETLVRQWLPIQAPGVIRSALGNGKFDLRLLSLQIHPQETCSCCWDEKQSTNNLKAMANQGDIFGSAVLQAMGKELGTIFRSLVLRAMGKELGTIFRSLVLRAMGNELGTIFRSLVLRAMGKELGTIFRSLVLRESKGAYLALPFSRR